jgi:hypothetical protein
MLGVDNSIKLLSRRFIGLLSLILLILRRWSSPVVAAAAFAFLPGPSSSSSNWSREERRRTTTTTSAVVRGGRRGRTTAPSRPRGAAAAPLMTRKASSSPSPSSSSSVMSPRDLVREGMRSFRDGDVPSSLSFFDAAEDSSPSPSGSPSLIPYLWQRGISYYYLDRFEDGHRQFRSDVAVNPNDVEEIVWDVACLARMATLAETTGTDAAGGGGRKFPPDGIMALPPGRKDPRRIMSTVLSLFRGDGATEWDLRRAGSEAGNARDEFYSLFYLGL